jgi:hypothetical protein
MFEAMDMAWDLARAEEMSEVVTASIRDQLWHRMRQDLAKFVRRFPASNC